MKEGEKQNLTMGDLQRAVDTINSFAVMYEKAQRAIKRLGKAEGRLTGMTGRGGDPFTSFLMSSLDGMVTQKLEVMAEQRAKTIAERTGLTTGEEEGVEEEELEEARTGLDES